MTPCAYLGGGRSGFLDSWYEAGIKALLPTHEHF